MSDIPVLISDLAIILFSAGLITILFKWLKQPVVLAGIIAGPYTFGGPMIMDAENIHIWADIGVIFLLFALGLDFSFKKLMNIGGTAMISALTIVGAMMMLGYITGLSLGWSHMDSLFLGGMLSMSSTTIIFKAFDDMGLRNQRFAGVVFGILVVEDLFAVVLMVLLSTLAVSKHFEGMEMVHSFPRFLVYYRNIPNPNLSEKNETMAQRGNLISRITRTLSRHGSTCRKSGLLLCLGSFCHGIYLSGNHRG